ncbi:MAG: YdcF family protein [Novosphingobium sp.]|nr:YdcF family protein [Novosphingobium sp.]
MLRRLLSFVVLIWLFGFLWFAIFLPGPHGAAASDAVVVLTGGEGRIARGLQALEQGWSRNLLVAGVDRDVTRAEFAAEYKVSPEVMACCVSLDWESLDTRSNAIEVSRWLARHRYRSVRLITTDWHMRRAAFELEQVKPKGVSIIRDSVPSRPSLQILFLEYHKLLARRLSPIWGGRVRP